MLIGLDGNEANVKDRVGSGIYAFEMLGEFSKNSEFQFIVYLKTKPLSDLPKETANFKYLVFGPKKLWTQIALGAKLAFGPKIDLFFSLSHYGPRFSKVAYAVTIFDLSYLHYPNLFKRDDLYQLTNWSKYSIKKSKHIFAISNSTKEDLVKNYKVAPSKIAVTYLGYDQKRFKPQTRAKIDQIKNKYKIASSYILFVGTLQPRKNIERLIEAFNQVIRLSGNQVVRRTKPENPMTRVPENLQLVIAGKKGWLYNSIFSKVKELGLDEKIIFTGYVSDEDLPPLISGAKAYVLPSLWEGFGIPVIEAQACGVPVVVSNTSSLPEIVTPPPVIPAKAGIQNKNQILDHVENDNKASAILVDPTNVGSIAKGIKKALEPKTRSDLINAGFVNIRRFSWQKCANQTLEVLGKLASNKAP